MSVLDSVTINDRRYTGKDVLNATTGSVYLEPQLHILTRDNRKPDQYQGKMLIEFDTGTTLCKMSSRTQNLSKANRDTQSTVPNSTSILFMGVSQEQNW